MGTRTDVDAVQNRRSILPRTSYCKIKKAGENAVPTSNKTEICYPVSDINEHFIFVTTQSYK
jgi:hypothetical protein